MILFQRLLSTPSTYRFSSSLLRSSFLRSSASASKPSRSTSWICFTDRSFASSSTSSDSKKNDDSDNYDPSRLPPFQAQVTDLATVSGRGIGQVIFLNDSKSGAFILGGLALGDPYLASLAAVGTISAHLTAQSIQLNRGDLDNGLWSYNGCLVGCAMAVFGPTSVAVATTSTIVGACCTPFVAGALKPVCGSMPQWTYAFNIVALTSLLRTRPLLTPIEIEPGTAETEFFTAMTDGLAALPVSTTPPVPAASMIDVMTSPLTGIAQIFVVESAVTGAIIVAGGITSYSPGLAAHAVAGSAIGAITGACLGAPTTEIAAGLWGFNSALTSMAIGVFLVHSTPTMLFSAGGAAATAAVFGAFKEIFGVYGSPCLTLPFCFTMSACYLLHKQIPGLALASSPHSPEKNTSKSKGGLSGL